MSTFSYDVEYAKEHGLIHAIVVSYCSVLDIPLDKIDVNKLCNATGLSKQDVCNDLKIDTSCGIPDAPVVPKQSKPQVNLFGNKRIISSNKPKPTPTNYADAICKYLPSLVKEPELLSALDKWVRVIYKSGKGITKEQVVLAINELDELSGGNTIEAIKIVNIATQAGYKVFSWCVPTYLKQQPTPFVHNREFTPRSSSNIDVVNEGF